MGFFDGLLGNASQVNLNEIQKEFTPLLAPNEQIENVGTGFTVTLQRIISGDLREVMWNDYIALALYLAGAIWLFSSLYIDFRRFFKRRMKKCQGRSEMDIFSSRWERHARVRKSRGYIEPGILIAVAFVFRDWYVLF
ncbi:hypothetical protein [Paenibacillus sp. An7]|uniref:hypothetical protein n=1 Tax=Paenibacillus sp. An7 TaxID=2689577 RepID=UPI00135C79AE|nr:hypothetical protein [Paenibacillus sp. An7]